MKELTKGYPAKVIVLFALPIMFGNIFQQLYNITDSKIVSYFVGPDSLGAVGATTVLTNTLIGFVIGLTQGFAIAVARFFGAGDGKGVRKSVANMVSLTFLFAVPIAILGKAFIRELLVLLNTPSDVLSDSSDYAGIILMGMLFVSLYNMCSNILRAVGDSKTPLVCLIAGVLSNVGLDLFYICVLGKGIKGAAYATVISQAISGFSSLFFLLKKYPEIIPKKDDWHIGSTLCKDMLLAGLSMGLMGCIVNIGSIILQQAINGFGTDILTAQTGARRLFDIMMVMVYTIGFSMTTYASQNMGAGRGDRVRQGVKHAIIIDTAITTVLIIFCFIFGERLMGWIASTDNPEIISNGTMYLKIGVVLFYVLGPLFILRCTLQGLGHRIMPLVSSGLELLTKIGFAGIFVPMLGYFGVAITEPVSWVIMIIPLIFSYASARKKI